MTEEEEEAHDNLLLEVQKGLLEQQQDEFNKIAQTYDDDTDHAKVPGRNRIYNNRFEMIPFKPKGAAQAARGNANSFLSVGPSGNVAIVVDRHYAELEEQYAKQTATKAQTPGSSTNVDVLSPRTQGSEMQK